MTNAPAEKGRAPRAGRSSGGKSRPEPLAVRLRRLGLDSDWSLALHAPLRYEDESRLDPIGLLRADQTAQIQGKVLDARVVQTPYREQFVVRVADETGSVVFRFLHAREYIRRLLPPGAVVRASGAPRPAYGGGLEFVHPKIRPAVADPSELPQTLTPVYPQTEGLQQSWLQRHVTQAVAALRGLEDPVPADVVGALGLTGFVEALEFIHRPPASADPAVLETRSDPHWRRIKFDELLAQQIALMRIRASTDRASAPALAAPAGGSACAKLLESLPFGLTGAQRRVWGEVEADLARPAPMHRLVQGDVGCGKTVIAALACLRAAESGVQAALMAPTEILAEQHLHKIAAWLEPLGVRTVWLSGRQKAAERKAALEAAASGEAAVIVGTHALIQDKVRFRNLGLAVVDEQHRFGVRQRLTLARRAENGLRPHLLMLSATPIPRTLAMSCFADIDISAIDELPPGRTPVTTKLVRVERRDDVTAVVNDAVSRGRQAYWVCPLIEESEALELRPAEECARELAERLPHVRVGLLHGAMSAPEKEAVMGEFVAGRIQVLVATTVIEVGVDVPNATLMVIEHAERFGLAQLHQLRGRVGRGGGSAACVLLFAEPLSDVGRERLKIIRESTDGFEIARRDLELRGPGEFLGDQQSGVPMLRFADLAADADLIEPAARTARRMLAEDPAAAGRLSLRWFPAQAELLNV